MIKISKSKFLEIVLEILTQDITTIRSKLMSILQKSGGFEINCIYDASIFKGESKFIEGKAVIGISEDESISKKDNRLLINFDYDSIGLIVSFLDKADRGEEFMPEICDIAVSGKKKEMTLILAIK